MLYDIWVKSRDFKRENLMSERDLNPELSDAGAMFHQLSYLANWWLVVMWLNDGYIYIYINTM